MKTILLFFSLIMSHSFFAQNKMRFPVWTFHDDSTIINGLSVGFNSSFNLNAVKVNGINFEFLGLGLLGPLMPMSPIRADSSTLKNKFLLDTIAIEINGINISPSGSLCDCNINGLNLNGMTSTANITNGLSITLFGNFAQIANGTQIAMIGNDTAFMNGVQFSFFTNSSQTRSNGVQISLINSAVTHKGIQIGGINKAEHLKGIQFGLWNKNQKRSLPIINWSFKS